MTKQQEDRKIVKEWKKYQKRLCFQAKWTKAGMCRLSAVNDHKLARAGGYGYCKESTVFADWFNDFFSVELAECTIDQKKLPYGLKWYSGKLCFCGGVGMSSIQECVKVFGYELSSVFWDNDSNIWILQQVIK